MTEKKSPSKPAQPPPAQGVRLEWHAVPHKLQQMVDDYLGSPVVAATSNPSGFSPGVASRLKTADDRQFFVKAVGPEPNPTSPTLHRREAQITALLPVEACAPRLLWWHDDVDDTGWVVLLFDYIHGHEPTQPWQADELERVLHALDTMANALTPSPLPEALIVSASSRFATSIKGWSDIHGDAALQDRLDDWSKRHLAKLVEIEQQASEAVAGNTLVHFDIRGDNMLLTPDRVWILDWPHASVGAAWVDIISFAPSVAMQGGPVPEDLIKQFPACMAADPTAITAAVVSLAGYFTYRALLPPPPGLPTVREFQNAQGIVACEWIAQRTGWK